MVLMEFFNYDNTHYQMFREVFGDRGVALAMRMHPPVHDTVNKTQVSVDQAMIRHTAGGFQNPLVVLHEFAHAYHANHWPELTADCETYRAEACAHLAEYAAALGHRDLMDLLLARMPAWSGKALLVVMNALRYEPGDERYGETGEGPVHDRMEGILNGRYG